MISTTAVLTLRLAEAIGVYWLASGIGLLLAPARLAALIDDLARGPGLVYAFGFGLFVVAEAALIAHRSTIDPLATIVTLIFTAHVVAGLLLLAWPRPLLAAGRALAPHARLWGIVAILLGLVLFVLGLTGRADHLPQGAL